MHANRQTCLSSTTIQSKPFSASCRNALSDVIINRPPPLRHFDQIYMKLPDMLLQAELIGR